MIISAGTAVGALLLAGCTANVARDAPTSSIPPSPSATQRPTHSKPTADAITNGPRNKPFVAITLDADFSPAAKERVDDGRYPKQTNQSVMRFLRESKIPATVFVTGMWAQEYPRDLAELAANANIELANHTWNHDAWTDDCYGLPYLETVAEKKAELTRTNQIVKAKTGDEMFWFRFPGLCHSQSDLNFVAKNGMQAVDTDVDASDAFAQDADAAAQSMLEATEPGSILLMHLNGEPNAPVTGDILRKLVAGLKQKGLKPVTLQTMFAQ